MVGAEEVHRCSQTAVDQQQDLWMKAAVEEVEEVRGCSLSSLLSSILKIQKAIALPVAYPED